MEQALKRTLKTNNTTKKDTKETASKPGTMHPLVLMWHGSTGAKVLET